MSFPQSPLQFHLNLTLVVESLDGSSERKHYSFDLNLGFPLIAMSREKFIRTEPPTSVREATEHEDHSTESDAWNLESTTARKAWRSDGMDVMDIDW